MKKLSLAPEVLREFNNPNTILIISSYPVVNGHKISNIAGVSNYTYNLVQGLEKLNQKDTKYIIISDIAVGSEIKTSNNFLILPTWEKNNLFLFKSIIDRISEFNKVTKILIQFEFNLFGDLIQTALFPLFIYSISNKNVSIVIHQVAENISSLQGHLGITSNFKLKILDFFYSMFYRFLCISKIKIIVHDTIFKQRLLNFGCTRKIKVIPHGLGEFSEKISSAEARRKLKFSDNDFILLCFGFVTWYKGIDLIINRIKFFLKDFPDSNLKLVIAGGPSHNLKDKPYYKKYYEDLVSSIKPYPQITITGFIENSEIPYYFSASDLVLFPYRTQMSASGPFATCLSFHKPFLLSDPLSPTLNTADIKQKMVQLGITKDDLTFKLTGYDVFKKITLLQENPEKILKITKLAKLVAHIRDWKNVSKMYLETIH